jgi:hypothetical protein
MFLGKGAVKDTCNLLAEGRVKLAGRLAEVDGEEVRAWAERQGLKGYWGSSLKGERATLLSFRRDKRRSG